MKLARRTFEALQHPLNSMERDRLNECMLTSEYMPSYKWTLLHDDGKKTYRQFRTKTEALEAIAKEASHA